MEKNEKKKFTNYRVFNHSKNCLNRKKIFALESEPKKNVTGNKNCKFKNGKNEPAETRTKTTNMTKKSFFKDFS